MSSNIIVKKGLNGGKSMSCQLGKATSLLVSPLQHHNICVRYTNPPSSAFASAGLSKLSLSLKEESSPLSHKTVMRIESEPHIPDSDTAASIATRNECIQVGAALIY